MSRHHTACMLFVLGSIVAFGSGGARAETAQEAIKAAGERFAAVLNRGDAAALAQMYTPDAAVMPPGSPRADGREAIQRFWQGAIEGGIGDFAPQPLEITAAGDLAFEVGTATLTVPAAAGGRQPVSAKYVVIWRRGEGGAWRLHRDIWNENPAEGR